jgi:hypothetical protein
MALPRFYSLERKFTLKSNPKSNPKTVTLLKVPQLQILPKNRIRQPQRERNVHDYDVRINAIEQAGGLQILQNIMKQLSEFCAYPSDDGIFEKLRAFNAENGEDAFTKIGINKLQQHCKSNNNLMILARAALMLAQCNNDNGDMMGLLLYKISENEQPATRGAGCYNGYRNRLWMVIPSALNSIVGFLPTTLQPEAIKLSSDLASINMN